jgi:hypothetical protein
MNHFTTVHTPENTQKEPGSGRLLDRKKKRGKEKKEKKKKKKEKKKCSLAFA